MKPRPAPRHPPVAIAVDDAAAAAGDQAARAVQPRNRRLHRRRDREEPAARSRTGHEEVVRPERIERDDPGRADDLVHRAAKADPLDVDYPPKSHQQDSVADGGAASTAHWASTAESGGGGIGGEDGIDFDSFAEGDKSLADHLLAQAGAVIDGPDWFIRPASDRSDRRAGYLTVPLLDIAIASHTALARVERVLAQIQTLDPTGVGARDLAECIALQAKEADRYDPCLARLIDNLDLLAAANSPASSACAASTTKTWRT